MNAALLIFLSLLWYLMDRMTKRAAEQKLKERPVVLFKIVHLKYAVNNGAFLSLGSALSAPVKWMLLVVLPIAFFTCLGIYFALTYELNASFAVSLSFLIGGAFGNTIDRMANRFCVTDFIQIRIGSLQTGIMNLADIFLVIGVIALLFAGF